VLTYLHDRGVIHRDLSPDNLMLRSPDHLPILIDFGAVKAAIAQTTAAGNSQTVIGKLGYAPPEQMQTGRVTPSSDLYALAVTAIVLLTGKDPLELYNGNQGTWNWQAWATVSPDLAATLNRMLRDRPLDRFSSAQAVLTLLGGTVPVIPAIVRPTRSLSPWDILVRDASLTFWRSRRKLTWLGFRISLFLLRWTARFSFALLKFGWHLIPKWLSGYGNCRAISAPVSSSEDGTMGELGSVLLPGVWDSRSSTEIAAIKIVAVLIGRI